MTDLADLGPHGLARVSGRDAVALTRAASVLTRLPQKLEAVLGEVGSAVVACNGLDGLVNARAVESMGDVALGLSWGAGAGRLVLDGSLARRMLVGALGGDGLGGAPLARLSLGERGVVAGLIASLLHALDAPFSVSLVAPTASAVSSRGGVAFALVVTIAGGTGWARLEIPADWFPATTSARDVDLATLEVVARVELACTRLEAVALAGLVPGDAIVFDGEPAFASESGGRPVRVVIQAHATSARAHAARARLSDEGRVTLESALGPIPVSAVAHDGFGDKHGFEGVTMKTREATASGNMNDATTTRTVDVAAVLAAVPIEIIAELGRLTLRGDEVAGLGPGAVLTFDHGGRSPVSLCVGGEIWADGELVDVDGELGVRVTSLRRAGQARE